MKKATKLQQENLELLFNKNQLIPTLKEEFKALTEDPFEIDVLTQIYLHRQADIVTMIGLLTPQYGTPQEVADRLTQLINKEEEDSLLDYDYELGMYGMFIVKYDLSEDMKDMLDKYQYPLPMVIKPKKITNNHQTGYETIQGSVILNGSYWFKDKDVCLNHLNKANSVALALDLGVLNSPQAEYKIPKRKIGEDFRDFKKRNRQAAVFYLKSIEVMEVLDGISDELYLTHKYDRRGRCYSSGYHFNTQGDDYHKACIQFSKKELVNG